MQSPFLCHDTSCAAYREGMHIAALLMPCARLQLICISSRVPRISRRNSPAPATSNTRSASLAQIDTPSTFTIQARIHVFLSDTVSRRTAAVPPSSNALIRGAQPLRHAGMATRGHPALSAARYPDSRLGRFRARPHPPRHHLTAGRRAVAKLQRANREPDDARAVCAMECTGKEVVRPACGRWELSAGSGLA